MYFNNHLDEGLDADGFIASPADYILGLGNKTKKAEKKIRKAEKATKAGNVNKAQRKLDKAEKKLGKSKDPLNERVIQKIETAQANIAAREQQKEQLSQRLNPQQPVAQSTQDPIMTALDPIAQGSGATIPGSGSLMQPGGGGGGGEMPDMSGEEIYSQLADGEQSGQKSTQETGNETKGNKKTGVIVLVVIALLVLAFFYFKRKKSI